MYFPKGCNVISSGNFTACHQAVSPTQYIEACQQETCLCKYGGDCSCFCAAVAAYVQECNRHGIAIYWRREGLCRKYNILQCFGSNKISHDKQFCSVSFG